VMHDKRLNSLGMSLYVLSTRQHVHIHKLLVFQHFDATTYRCNSQQLHAVQLVIPTAHIQVSRVVHWR
jgi:hypothetical protein